eukprot:TRINITY_DN67688_c0_g1_i1.p1 TRINITY_DN67688_c0_g1~~TRINITY_DN67688_c0_g1_i1.p1  ORF type:complete len:446 (+),score=31.65 TRINITY_DN67688_c0_g1_i1:184-1338(+)
MDDCAANGDVPASTGRWKDDMSVYTGLGGIALAYLRVGMLCQNVRKDTVAAKAHFERARDVAATCLRKDPQSREVSFFCGTPGYIAISYVTTKLLGDETSASAHLRALLTWCPRACDHAEDELLFGRAGYLYALLWVKKYVGSVDVGVFDQPLRQTAERLVMAGQAHAQKQYRDWSLMWQCFREPYLGAAHGSVGILTMLFHCYGLLSIASQELTRGALHQLLACRFRSGNVPIILGDASDEHVHWCHGAAGLPALFSAAAVSLGDADGRLQTAALQAGEVIWERGVILKGNGLCHGISGNAYAFLTLYRHLGDSAQLSRATAFSSLLWHGEIQQAVRRQPDSQRRVIGVPDSPRSLMEGTAGVICLLADLCSPDVSAFPGWEF